MILSGDSQIEILKLNENNKIEDESIIQLAQCFLRQTSLKVLEIAETNLRAEGFYELVRSLATNEVAERVSCRLCRVQLTDTTKIKEIKEFLSQNCSLLELDISGNLCGDELERFVKAEVAKNKMIVERILPNSETFSVLVNQPFEKTLLGKASLAGLFRTESINPKSKKNSG